MDSTQDLSIQIVVDNNSWILPYAESWNRDGKQTDTEYVSSGNIQRLWKVIWLSFSVAFA